MALCVGTRYGRREYLWIEGLFNFVDNEEVLSGIFRSTFDAQRKLCNIGVEILNPRD